MITYFAPKPESESENEFQISPIIAASVHLANNLSRASSSLDSSATSSSSSVVPVIFLLTTLYELGCLVLHKKSVHITSMVQFFFYLILALATLPMFVKAIQQVRSKH